MKRAKKSSSPIEAPNPRWWRSIWLKSAAIVILLIAGFYLVSDLLGAWAWSRAQTELATAGQSLAPQTYIPPPVPEEQNFGALPLFKLEPDPQPGSPNNKSPLPLKNALARVAQNGIPSSEEDARHPDRVPYLGNWRKNEKPNLPTIGKRLLELNQKTTPAIQTPDTFPLTTLFAPLCPALADLRAANASRPLCRFDLDYETQPAWMRPLSGITSLIHLSQVLAYEERLALLDHRPDLALDDMKVAWKIDAGLRQEPLVVSGLVSIGVVMIQLGVASEGLAQHAWNDQQLADLDQDLGKIDFLTEGQLSLRGELATNVISNVDAFRDKKSQLSLREVISANSGSEFNVQNLLLTGGFLLIPRGWFDQYKADYLRAQLLGTLSMVDPTAHRVFPEKETESLRLINETRSTIFWRNRIISSIMPIASSIKKFAEAQARLDLARIACRLERYRLAHGKYPEALAYLIPAYGATLPRDVMSGDDYHYKLNPDGTYLLYSVGWNQKDDNGTTVFAAGTDSPDWAWTSHPDAAEPR